MAEFSLLVLLMIIKLRRMESCLSFKMIFLTKIKILTPKRSSTTVHVTIFSAWIIDDYEGETYGELFEHRCQQVDEWMSRVDAFIYSSS